MRTETLIVGLGKSGLSCARYLTAKQQPFSVMDSRPTPPLLGQFKKEFPDIAMTLGNFDKTRLKQAKTLILAPGISLKESAIQSAIAAGVEVIGDIELLMRETQNKAPKIALITGSNGKSTVTTLLFAMAKAAGINTVAGANLGEPALDLLPLQADLMILELSSFQLETTPSLHSDVATLLNISPDHLDRYADLAEYTETKQQIYNNTKTSVVNLDDPQSGQNQQGKIIPFSLTPIQQGWGLQTKENALFITYNGKAILNTQQLKIRGRHNISNALASLALGSALDLPQEAMLNALQQYTGLPHRVEFVREIQQVEWINDSKATNVGACIAAIQGLGARDRQNIILLAGGQAKGADFKPLLPAILAHVHHAILFGEDSEQIATVLTDQCGLIRVNTLDEAVNHAFEIAEKGDIVLFSPACASFDLFQNFEHRGECFKEAVQRLPT